MLARLELSATASPQNALAATLLSSHFSEEVVRSRTSEIHELVLAHSRYINQPNFTAIHPRDLEFLFASYDDRFFSNLCRSTLNNRKLTFRLSPRMTKVGGTTARVRARNGEESFEIAIAVDILFKGFAPGDRPITVCGLECGDRIQALQRIFEHEMVHLVEWLCWAHSNCSAARFQDIARRFFLHRAHTHNLITFRERAANSGFRVGSRVTFTYEGKVVTGRVNRITKRATVLVEHPEGTLYSDGLRYKTYYVPIASLNPASTEV